MTDIRECVSSAVLFTCIGVAFFGLGVWVGDEVPDAALAANICGAVMLAVACYCLWLGSE
jgi:hypothetical protein